MLLAVLIICAIDTSTLMWRYDIGKCDITNGAGAARADATLGGGMAPRMSKHGMNKLVGATAPFCL